MIRDARERRQNGNKELQCEDCNYKTKSITLLKRHIECVHVEDENVIEESVERMMRERHKCDDCGFKSISKDVLEKHRKIMHEKKKGPVAKETKRRKCDACQKRFNKEETFKKHMQTVHGGAETTKGIAERQITERGTMANKKNLRNN